MSNKKYCYELKSIILNSENSPLVWTQEDFDKITNHKKVIGYLFRVVIEKFNTERITLNLYLLNSKLVDADYSLEYLKNAMTDWLSVLYNDRHATTFKNPPLNVWLDTKDNWITMSANKLATKFSISFDEAKSHLYYAIVKAYNRGDVYMNSLDYLYKSAINEILMEIRRERNKLNITNGSVVSIDTVIAEDNLHTGEEILGEEDKWYEEYMFDETKKEIFKDLSAMFSEREIDQIINVTQISQLPRYLYLKLLKWRKLHKRGDYNV